MDSGFWGLALLLTTGLLAQPEFEVASIKPFPHPVTGNSMSYTFWKSMARSSSHGRFNLPMVTLKGLVLAAYDVNDFQIVGGPSWIDNEGYDVEAKAGSNATYAQMKPMLQRLLADRFKLAIHRETRELPVYEMGVAKGGLKIAPPKGGNCITPDPGSPAAPLGSKVCGGIARRFYELTGYAITMPEFLDSLMAILGRTVIDKTSFKDRFDIDLKFDPCSAASGIGNVPAGENSAKCGDFSSYPSISNALRDQLGLRLESTKGPAEVLVIDHVEKPTAN